MGGLQTQWQQFPHLCDLLSPLVLPPLSSVSLSEAGQADRPGCKVGLKPARLSTSLSPTPPPPQAPEAQRATSKSSSTPPINVLGNRFSEFYISLRMSSQRSGLQLFKAGTSSLTSRLSSTARSESRCVCMCGEQGRLFIPPRTIAHTMQLKIRVGQRGEDKDLIKKMHAALHFSAARDKVTVFFVPFVSTPPSRTFTRDSVNKYFEVHSSQSNHLRKKVTHPISMCSTLNPMCFRKTVLAAPQSAITVS